MPGARGKERGRFGEVYDFVHRNNLPVCIFSLWTWASLNFGELNLRRPPRLKNTRSEEQMWPIAAEEDTFLFRDVISNYDFCLFSLMFLCLRVMYSFACISCEEG